MGLTVAEYAREFRAGDRRIVQHFKWLLTTAPVLVIPRVGKFVLCSDACDTGCGGMHLKLCRARGRASRAACSSSLPSRTRRRSCATSSQRRRCSRSSSRAQVQAAACGPGGGDDPKYVSDSQRVQRWIWLLSDVNVRVFYPERQLNVVPD